MWATADWDSHPGTSVILKCKEKKTQLMFCHWWRQTGQIIVTNFSFKFSVWNFSEIPSMVFLLTLFNVCNVICNDILLLHPPWPCSRPLWGEHNGDQRAHHFPPPACNTTKSCAPLQRSHKTATTQSPPLCGVPQGTAVLSLKIKVVEVKQHVYRWGGNWKFPCLSVVLKGTGNLDRKFLSVTHTHIWW